MKFQHLTLLLLTAAAPFLARAQDSSSGTTPGAIPVATRATEATPSAAPAATEKKKPKKVWTDEDVSAVKGGISVVGDPDKSSGELASRQSSQTSGGKDLRQQLIEKYRNQIEQWQAQMDATDKRIRQLKNFKGENAAPSGGINPSQGYTMVPLEDQVKQLQETKKQLQAKRENLESEARRNGIASGDLR